MLSENDFASLSDYLDGALHDEARRALEARLTADRDLQAALRDLRANRLLLRALPTVPPPRHFTLTRDQAERIRPRPRRSWRQWFPALQWATALATLGFVFTLGAHIGLSTQTAALPPVADTLSVMPMMIQESAPAATSDAGGVGLVAPTPDPAAGRMADETTPDPSLKAMPPPAPNPAANTFASGPADTVPLSTLVPLTDWGWWAVSLGTLAAALAGLAWWSRTRM